jgi:hypothetical protein
MDPPPAAIWVPTPPSFTRLCYLSVWLITLAYFTHTHIPPFIALMSCPALLGIHTLWAQAREEYESDQVKYVEARIG